MEFETFINQNIKKDLLRFITCGSVDDGKSTLIGRLLYDSHKVYEDQLLSAERDSRKYGTQGKETDLALLLDGLQSEREQKITIDVAYRYFSTDKRKFIIADCPGHEQYTRNMATGASTAALAILLIDARKGVQPQTIRHASIVKALGIKSIVVAINKMDTIDYGQQVYDDIKTSLGSSLSEQCIFIPISALKGDNVVLQSMNMPWYTGPTLLSYLEEVHPLTETLRGIRLPIQYVIRPNQDFRGYSGTLIAGDLNVGQPITILPQCKRAIITSISIAGSEVQEAAQGQPVVITLDTEIDIARGTMIAGTDTLPIIARRWRAQIVWMSSVPLIEDLTYDFKVGNQWASGHFKSDNKLEMNDIEIVSVYLETDIIFDPYSACKQTGSFIITDRVTNETVGAGMILQTLGDIIEHSQTVTKNIRSIIKKQKPHIIWFTGLSSSGKSTLANAVESQLNLKGYHTYLLDGDNLRMGLNKDLDFSIEGREENLRRVGEVAKLFVDAGLIVLCAFISPFEKDREWIRNLVDEDEFTEVYVSTPLATCEQRDIKGFYARAQTGGLKQFTGISALYEPPLNPDIIIDTTDLSVEDCTRRILSLIHLPPR